MFPNPPPGIDSVDGRGAGRLASAPAIRGE